MPKIIELTVELEIQKVSCPGVWLCQDGRVSLTVFALGTSYQTCMLPPVFPLSFKDVFYFRKRFQESCALNNICCILKDETIYCELVQWSNNCRTGECTVLAQYLGAINDVLFPPNMCSNDGVDLLMRRAKEFPGILSPKIEIATKVRIDEVWDAPCLKAVKVPCNCSADSEGARQRQVCHSAQYHRNKCNNKGPPAGLSVARSRSRSRSRSGGSRSCCSLTKDTETNAVCDDYGPIKSRTNQRRCFPRRRQYNVYNVQTSVDADWPRDRNDIDVVEDDYCTRSSTDFDKAKPKHAFPDEDRIQKMILESRYINHDHIIFEPKLKRPDKHKHSWSKVTPCVCEICRRYHELFHTGNVKS